MFYSKKLPVFIIAMLILGCGKIDQGEQVSVYHRGTIEYDQKVQMFAIPPKEAAQRLRKATDQKIYRKEDPFEIIIGDYYFEVPNTTDPHFSGHYIHGNTGQIERRKSSKRVKRETTVITSDEWEEITIIRESYERQEK